MRECVNERAPRQQRALPKAQLSEAVARRLWRNANAVPIKRFDSADFFLNKYLEERQQRSRSDSGEDMDVDSNRNNLSTPPTNDTLSLPLPLSNPNASRHLHMR